MEMQVSIIIVNYNTRKLTVQCIESIYKHTVNINYEIILIDNASSDNSVSFIKEHYPKVKLIVNEINVGFGRANNQGASLAKGEFIFLLNSDTLLISNAVLEFYQFFKSQNDSKLAICGAELLSGLDHKIISYGNFPSILDAFSSIGFFRLYKSFYYKHIASGVVNFDQSIKYVDYITGADMFINKSIFNEVGGFDEDFFMYFEETELSYRISKKGYKSILLPFIKIIHLEGQSQLIQGQSFNYGKYERFVKSRSLYFMKTHGKIVNLVTKILYTFQLLIFTLLRKECGNIFYKISLIFKN